MSNRIILVAAKSPPPSPKPKTSKPGASSSDSLWMATSGVLLLLLIASIAFAVFKIKSLNKKIKFEDFRNKETQKKYKLALETLTKMEKNPDLIHSREFNLDYLRMRMSEEVFHYAVVNQIKVKVKDKISVALRPVQGSAADKGNAGAGRQIDSMFDVEYETGDPAIKLEKRVLFRIQIKLMKLPTQATSQTINQIIDCLETYLSPSDEHDNWQPTIQGRIVHIEWDQKAKPTPMLVLDQSADGVNVTFRTTRQPGGVVPTPPAPKGGKSPATSGTTKAGGKTSAKRPKN